MTPEDISARRDIEAHAGGKTINEVTSDCKQRKSKIWCPNRWLELAANKGSGKVAVSTVSGRVYLKTK